MNKSQQKRINQQLIIYRSLRHHQALPNQIKYGLYPRRLDSTAPKDSSKSLKRLLSFSMKKYISRASYSVTLNKPITATSLRRIVEIRNIKHLDLYVGLACAYDSRQQTLLDLRQNKIVKRIFMTCSRLIKLKFIPLPMIPECILPFKYTTLLPSLQHFHWWIIQGFYQHIQILSNHLLRHHQKQTHSFDISISHDWELGHFKDVIEKLALMSPNSNITLTFSDFPDAKTKEITSFAQMLQNLPSLKRLSLTSFLTKSFLHFLQNIQNSQNLQNLFLILSPSGKTSEILTMLPQLFSSLKSLTDLRIIFKDFQKTRSLNPQIFEGLDKCAKLTTLRLDFKKCQYFNDSICNSLLGSLKNMQALEHLALNMDSLAITSSQIQEIWTVIGSLTCLQVLDLGFEKLGDKACDENFGILCKSLKKLPELTILWLKMSDSHINDTGIIQLSKVISGLKKLRILELDFSGAESKWILGDNISRLARSLESHKVLSDLALRIKCLDIDDLCAKALISSLRCLKSLDRLNLKLESVDLDENIEQFLKQNLEQLKLRYEVSFSLK